MKRLLFIGLPLLILLGVGGWFFFGTSSGPTPQAGNTATSSPFGSGEGVVGIPATQPDFEGEVAPLPETSTESGQAELKLFKLEA